MILLMFYGVMMHALLFGNSLEKTGWFMVVKSKTTYPSVRSMLYEILELIIRHVQNQIPHLLERVFLDHAHP